MRTLRVLDLVFYQRMRKESLLSRDELAQLFPNLPELVEAHSEPRPAPPPASAPGLAPSPSRSVPQGPAVQLSPRPLCPPPRLLVRSHEEAAGRGPRHRGSRRPHAGPGALRPLRAHGLPRGGGGGPGRAGQACDTRLLSTLPQFDGPAREELQRVAARFCSHQSAALELVKAKQRKDSRFQLFMQVRRGLPWQSRQAPRTRPPSPPGTLQPPRPRTPSRTDGQHPRDTRLLAGETRGQRSAGLAQLPAPVRLGGSVAVSRREPFLL